MKHLQLATGNAKKVGEFKALLEPLGFTLVPAPAGFEVDENADTFAGNAIKKAAALCQQTGLPSVADDSGLSVDALAGAPGVHSARYAGASGPNQDAANRQKLLEALKDIEPKLRTAHFVCAIALCTPGEEPRVFEGEVHGRIIDHEDGDGGFGYDSLFIPEGREETFARMPAADKHAMSHRGSALRKLVAALG
jgi:XTP/dITP diphosphohydrolase